MTADLPQDVTETALTLTRRARQARDDDAAADHRRRRDELLADHGYEARIREDDDREVLVLYPAEWLEDGTVRTERIDDVDRGVELPLSGPADPDDWDAVDAHNRQAVERVRERHGEAHAANAAAFADFLGNHYAKRLERSLPGERAEFLEEYYPRNAWPTDDQAAVVGDSVELAVEAARELATDDRPASGAEGE
jgi:hypothetical protein